MERSVHVVECGKAVRPWGWDGLTLPQEPIGFKYLTQICSQTAAVVDHCTKFLHLDVNTTELLFIHNEGFSENTTMCIGVCVYVPV